MASKYELTLRLVLVQLEMSRDQIEHGHLEQLTLEVKYRPHGGGPRFVKVGCLNAYEGAASEEPVARAERVVPA